MEIKSILSVVAGFLMALAFVPYITAILQKRAKPVKVTWITWATLDAITIAGMYAEDAMNSQILVASTGSWVVFFLSLKYGVPGWTKFDKFCLASALAGICIWCIFNNPLYGILISLAVMFIGSMPTFVSAWQDPNHEDKFAWSISCISSVCAVIAIPHWTLADSGQPINFLVITGIMVYILYTKRKNLNPRA